ncbi:MAG: AAA family ATPase [Deltaproteobacteria bacterium]|nr:AAA family ATPase [Deltaproteobacteria bacterium]
MIVTRLKLTNVRGVEDAEFAFKAGLNLIVGVNGVGKTTALDVLRICFSRVLPGLTPSLAKAMSFERSDICLGFPFLNAVAHFSVAQEEYVFERREWRETVAADDEENLAKLRREIIETERPRERARKLLRELATPQSLVDSDFYSPDKAALRTALSKAALPLAVFYSTNRSVITATQSKGKSVGGQAAAYTEALLPRSWNIEQFADWIRAQEAMAKERENAGRHVAAMKAAATRFLPECTDLSAGKKKGDSLTVTKGGLELDVRQLSDGERGVLGVVLDLARRLAQVNPESNDPLADGQAVVLVDEIDLHLHPKWQRQIIRNLEATFPRCQFIATTHSPQVIGEVPADRIQIIANGQVYSPTHSFGVDSSRVLEEIMDSLPRSSEVQDLLDRLLKIVAANNLKAASNLVTELAAKLGEHDAEVLRARTLLDFLGGEG